MFQPRELHVATIEAIEAIEAIETIETIETVKTLRVPTLAGFILDYRSSGCYSCSLVCRADSTFLETNDKCSTSGNTYITLIFEATARNDDALCSCPLSSHYSSFVVDTRKVGKMQGK